MFIGDVWIDGAPSQFYFLIVPPIFSLLIWLIELQSVHYLSLRIIHIIFCWFSFFDIFIIEFLIWSLRDIERIVGPRQFRNFFFYNFIIYIPFCILTNVVAPKNICLPLGYFYPFSLFIFMLAFIPSTSIFLIITDKLFITLGFILIIAVYVPYSLVPLITAIIGNLMWYYDVFHLSKCSALPLEISDDDMVVIPSMRDHISHHRHQGNNRRNHNRNRNRNPEINALLNPISNINLTEEETAEVEVRPEDIRQITEMGFEEDQARNALERCHNNIRRAVEILINHE